MNITFKGNPVTLVGTQLKVGDKAPDFTVVDNNMEDFSLKNTKGVRIISAVPSLDTPVCDLETKTFNKEASNIPNVSIYTISMDLPFAQIRWCGDNGIDNLTTLSDFKDRLFGKNYGTYVKELGLLARAVFVIDSNDNIVYAEYVEEIGNQPNFEKVLEAARNAK
ncbi:thiol peroxidase [Clostridium cochlearium]|jgi:thiol peroxidase|uniref:thiol peroxidase n=1 Tax=Clostridium cochlearium TaxID=1494 RepID=UPI001459215A|nr:thiol peroxidase [Clostridium cochlearium]MBV1821463.1 thiol peroxidase [Bacteroidales bacterium MSK.15.36]MCG4571103.1 thiol peroxidase [Clostridium cochlearium]MCR1971400.1 thiol peroxidase [Clostridium cochlearium]NMA57385.1 thiol peroxidase [Clostridium cochlearium]NME95626.1 thiol peroxidase [Clostridium cochlearium]